ncbi:hypothetical protein IAT38_000410 [Cryptococcus sp. DSM 104549]
MSNIFTQSRQFTAATNASPPSFPPSSSQAAIASGPSQPLSLPGWGASDPVYSGYNVNLPHPGPLDPNQLPAEHPLHPANPVHQAYLTPLAAGGEPTPLPHPAPLDLSRFPAEHPANPANPVHQAYLAYLIAGGEPIPLHLPVSDPTPIYGQGWDMDDDGDMVMEGEWEVDEVGDAVMAGDMRGSVGVMGPGADFVSTPTGFPAQTSAFAPAPDAPAPAPTPSAFPRLPALSTDNAPALFPEATSSSPTPPSTPAPSPTPQLTTAPLPAAYCRTFLPCTIPSSADRARRFKTHPRPAPYVRPRPRYPVPGSRPGREKVSATHNLILPPSSTTSRSVLSAGSVPPLPVYVMVWLPDKTRAWAFEAPGSVRYEKIWCKGKWPMLFGLPVGDFLRRMAEDLRESGFDAEAVDLRMQVEIPGNPVVHIGDGKHSNWQLARFLKYAKGRCGKDEVELTIKQFRKPTPKPPTTPAPAAPAPATSDATPGANLAPNPQHQAAIIPAPSLAPPSTSGAPSPDGEAPATPLQNVHTLPPSQIPPVHIQGPSAAFRSFSDIMAGTVVSWEKHAEDDEDSEDDW